jgi:hypothetical protein
MQKDLISFEFYGNNDSTSYNLVLRQVIDYVRELRLGVKKKDTNMATVRNFF